jgi:ESCRT-I complex subunit TSG101
MPPPPPLPANPELLLLRSRLHLKLSHSLSKLIQSSQGLESELTRVEQDLNLGEPAIRDEMERLTAVRSLCLEVVSHYRGVIKAGEGRLEEYRQRGEGPEIDEMICSTTVVHNQLLDLIAEDLALEDTLYHLGRGLYSDLLEIDLDRFLKVRSLPFSSLLFFSFLFVEISNQA